jgi:hypothetical protein
LFDADSHPVTLKTAKWASNVVAASLGLIAAGLWRWSARARVPDDPNDWGAKITEDDGKGSVDILQTVKVAAHRNKYAAIAASAAAFFQAVGTFIPET